jgi:hypothetical protein
MTLEERIEGLEDALTNLSRILELKVGHYAKETFNPEIAERGAEIHGWIRAVQEHRAGT